MTTGKTPHFPPEHAEMLCRAVALATASRFVDVERLASLLYGRWYAAPTGPQQGMDPTWPPVAGLLREGHVAANDWRSATVQKVGAAGVLVVREADGRPWAVTRGAYTHFPGSNTAGFVPQAGDKLKVLRRSGAVVTEGWWRTWGGGWDPRSATYAVTRIYLCPDVGQLPQLTNVVTEILEHAEIPWMIKVGVDAETLSRPDGFVVYLRDADADAALSAVSQRTTGLVRQLQGPPLSFLTVPGVSWAQDPGDGRSFGESRCTLVAEALTKGSQRSKEVAWGGRGSIKVIAEVFVGAGLDPERPHLRAAQSKSVP